MQGERWPGTALLASLMATACLQNDKKFENHMKTTSLMKPQSQSQFSYGHAYSTSKSSNQTGSVSLPLFTYWPNHILEQLK